MMEWRVGGLCSKRNRAATIKVGEARFPPPAATDVCNNLHGGGDWEGFTKLEIDRGIRQTHS